MYKQPIDNDRLPTSEVFERCAKMNWEANEHSITYEQYKQICSMFEHKEFPSLTELTKQDRDKIHRKVQTAIIKGVIIKTPCIICGNARSEAHHENYSLPLEVIFMCKDCHELRHSL